MPRKDGKVTPEARQMRDDARKGMTNPEIAAKYSLNQNYAVSILKNHRHHDPEFTPLSAAEARELQPAKRPTTKLTYELAQEIRALYAAGGWSYTKLAEEYGVTFENIGYLIRGKTWTRP